MAYKKWRFSWGMVRPFLNVGTSKKGQVLVFSTKGRSPIVPPYPMITRTHRNIKVQSAWMDFGLHGLIVKVADRYDDSKSVDHAKWDVWISAFMTFFGCHVGCWVQAITMDQSQRVLDDCMRYSDWVLFSAQGLLMLLYEERKGLDQRDK
jgi:hypothetical protein